MGDKNCNIDENILYLILNINVCIFHTVILNIICINDD